MSKNNSKGVRQSNVSNTDLDENSKNKSIKPLKITTVGDGMVGKTCMLYSYAFKSFPTAYVPTVFDNYAESIEVDGETYCMSLWDTAGQEDYERLRPLSYPNTNCFLLCFSVISRASYENASTKWITELRHHCPKVPIVLVGTKTDARDQIDPDHVSHSDGKKLRNKIKAYAYVECSAKLQEGLHQIFETAVRAAVKSTNLPSKHNCALL